MSLNEQDLVRIFTKYTGKTPQLDVLEKVKPIPRTPHTKKLFVSK